MPWNKSKITIAQQRILDLLVDDKPHALYVELQEMGHWNQFPAVEALEIKGLIRVVVEGGYYSRWERTNKVVVQQPITPPLKGGLNG